MPRPTLLVLLLLVLGLLVAPTAAANDHETGENVTTSGDKTDEEAKDKKDNKEDEDKLPEPSITQHTITIDGQEIAYTATAGHMLLEEDGVKDKAQVFFIAYTKDDVEDSGTRPITYCFNGGPGSSSVWLHLGALGPKRVKLPDDATPARPPHRVVENPFSLLDVTDLVFIDPVSTGYSRPVEGEDKDQFHGYREDLRSVGQFIHDYTSKYGRWGSPKFLIGESYGGLRAAGLTDELADRYNLLLNGVVLLSSVVDFQTIAFSNENDLPYAMFMPSYTATAWYHGKLDKELQDKSLEDVVAEARTFARDVYLPALTLGSSLPAEQRTKVTQEYSRLTGLSEEYVDNSNLRVSSWRFFKELLRGEHKVVGRFDGRYTGTDRDNAGEAAEHDPSAAGTFGPFTSAMNDYLFSELKYQEDGVYEILTGNVQPWSYRGFENRYVSASESLRKVITENPYMKVFVACGYYDLATPFCSMEYTYDHLGLTPELQGNISFGFYEAGHMMYVREQSLEKLRKDLLKFYQDALEGEPGS